VIIGCAFIVLVRYNKYSVQNERVAINEIDVLKVSRRFPWQAILQIKPKEKMQNKKSAISFVLLAVFSHPHSKHLTNPPLTSFDCDL